MDMLVTGGTGSIGRTVVKHLLDERHGVRVFSRDEAKQHAMCSELTGRRLHFQIGDIRDPTAIAEAVRYARVVIHCAAMKHVTACEAEPLEAVWTNVIGTHNLIRAVLNRGIASVVVAVSTDKACEPSGVMGCTKAIMERLIIRANQIQGSDIATRFVLVRFGNVVPSRGSIFPLFQRLAEQGEPIMVTSTEMTRFLLPLSQTPKVIMDAVDFAKPGEIFVSRIKSARILEIAEAFIAGRDSGIIIGKPRPGEKIHELLVTASEAPRTWIMPGTKYFVVTPVWAEPARGNWHHLTSAYSSGDNRMSVKELTALLKEAM